MTGRAERYGDLSPGQVDGLVTFRSRCSAPETLDRARASLAAKAIEVFACIEHAAAAASAGLSMPAATVLVFGNPRAGTPLMKEAGTVAIDLPLRMLIWDDRDGCTWISYNQPSWLGQRHGLPDDAQPGLDVMARLLGLIASEASGEVPS